MSIIVDDSVGYIAGMLNIDVISNGRGEWEGIIRHPKGRLNGRIISNFSISSNSNWIIKSINDSPKSNIAIMGNKDIAEDSSIGSNMGSFG